MKEYVGIPTEALEAARENRELRKLAEATDRRIEAACKSAEAVRAAQEARAKKFWPGSGKSKCRAFGAAWAMPWSAPWPSGRPG